MYRFFPYFRLDFLLTKIPVGWNENGNENKHKKTFIIKMLNEFSRSIYISLRVHNLFRI